VESRKKIVPPLSSKRRWNDAGAQNELRIEALASDAADSNQNGTHPAGKHISGELSAGIVIQNENSLGK
jgi:hypothetical protein